MMLVTGTINTSRLFCNHIPLIVFAVKIPKGEKAKIFYHSFSERNFSISDTFTFIQTTKEKYEDKYLHLPLQFLC